MPISKILEASLESGLYAAKAWVNFNGTGTVAIRASGNVSSITDNGTGSYTVNFTTAMPDANYSVYSGADNGDFGVLLASTNVSPGLAPSASSFRMSCTYVGNGTNKANYDPTYAYAAIFR